MGQRTFFGTVFTVHTVVLGRCPEVREGEVDLVNDALHGGQDELAEAVSGVWALGHDMGLERDEGVGVRHGLLCGWGMCRGEPSDLGQKVECRCRSHVVEAENHQRHDQQRSESPRWSRVELHCCVRRPAELVVFGQFLVHFHPYLVKTQHCFSFLLEVWMRCVHRCAC